MTITTRPRLAVATTALVLACAPAWGQDASYRRHAVSAHVGGLAIQNLRGFFGGNGAVVGAG